jgi:hypothetical protein
VSAARAQNRGMTHSRRRRSVAALVDGCAHVPFVVGEDQHAADPGTPPGRPALPPVRRTGVAPARGGRA